MPSVSRRLFLSSALAATALAGCSADRSSFASLLSPSLPGRSLSGRTLAKPNSKPAAGTLTDNAGCLIQRL